MEDYSVKTTTNLSSAIKHALGLEQTFFVLLLWIAQNRDGTAHVRRHHTRFAIDRHTADDHIKICIALRGGISHRA